MRKVQKSEATKYTREDLIKLKERMKSNSPDKSQISNSGFNGESEKNELNVDNKQLHHSKKVQFKDTQEQLSGQK